MRALVKMLTFLTLQGIKVEDDEDVLTFCPTSPRPGVNLRHC